MQGTIAIVIFVCCIVLFVLDRLPMAATAILGCTLMVALGVCDFTTVFGKFSSSTVILTIGVMVIGAAISETGLAKVIGEKIIQVSKGSKTGLIIFSYLTATIMSAFLTNSAVLAIFIPIIVGVCRTDNSLGCKELIMPITLGCILGGATTLAGSTQQLVTQGMLEATGNRTFGMFDLTLLGTVIAVFGLLYCLTVGKYIGNRIWDKKITEMEISEKTSESAADRKKIVTILIIFSCTVVFYITEWVPLAVTSTFASIACIITGCITQQRAIQCIDWNTIGRFGGYLGMAKALEVSGGSQLITDAFGKVIGNNVSPVVLLVVIIVLTKLISEFMSPSAALLIVLPLVFSAVEDLGLNTYSYALAATFAASTAVSTPLASTTLGMSMSVGYQFKDYFKYFIVFDIVSGITIIIMVPQIYGLTV